MSKNSNLQKAKNLKNDEFYTLFSDIVKELAYYKEHFRGKIVYCNCDNPEWSAFWRYFHKNFSALGLKKLISTHYEKEKSTYKMIYTGGNDPDIMSGVKIPLHGKGEFRSAECLRILQYADVIVSNPPFSLARSYMQMLGKFEKKYLVVGDLNWISSSGVFPYLRDNKTWVGVNTVSAFIQPDGSLATFCNKLWFTNLDHKHRSAGISLTKMYDPKIYPRYDNYNAIEVSKVKDIPKDYDGVMGVPITFLQNFNPEQFEVLGIMHSTDRSVAVEALRLDPKHRHSGIINGKEIYKRVLIRRRG